jgi:hypothetical protein
MRSDKLKPAAYLIIALIIIIASGCATPGMKPSSGGQRPVSSPFVQKEVEHIGQFRWDQRIQLLDAIDELALRLLRTASPPPFKQAKSYSLEGSRRTIIALRDRDMDGKADNFAILAPGEVDTDDFFFIFDLNNDGQMDYFVFNGGLHMTKDIKPVWMNYHFIDSNYDGKIDILVYDVDLEGDGRIDENLSAWIYDTNYDGVLDKAEYLGKGFELPIRETEGGFLIKTSTGEKHLEKDKLRDMKLHGLFAEVNNLIAQR